MKKILKRILIIVLILLILNNFWINPIYASTGIDSLGDFIGGLISGAVGVLTYLYRAPAVAGGWLINRFMTTLAYAEKSTDPTTNTNVVLSLETLTVFDVLFTKPKLIDINFFDITDGDTSLVNQFRINVAAWFYIMRTISAGILLVILIYIGIRMATSTIASDRAVYKRMLADWTVSLLLIFILNYIIIFTIEINNALVRAMAAGQTSSSGLSEAIATFGNRGIKFLGGIPSIVAAIIYIMLLWQTLGLFFAYFNRMLKVAFLIIIAPLISLTYSIDKIGDGKAQALDAWLKEFVFTILMQPFHCAIYMSLISTSFKILVERGGWNEVSQTLGAGILAIVCILFTRDAEKIVRKIFGFKDDNKSTSLVAGAMLASTALNKAKSAGASTAKFAQGTKNFLKNAPDALRWTNIKAEGKAAWGYLRGRDLNGNASDKDYATLRAESRTHEYEKKASKWEKELVEANKGKDASKQIRVMAEDIAAEQTELANNNPNMSEDEIKAVARFNVTKRALQDASVPFKNGKFHLIRSSKRAIRKVTSAPGKAYKAVGNKISSLSEKAPLAETRKILAEEVKKAPGFLVGAGMLGTTGKVSSAAAGFVATNKFVEGVTKYSKGSIERDLQKFAIGHSQQDIGKLIGDVESHSARYQIDKDSSNLPEHLKKLIQELNEEAKGQKYSETAIKNAIVNNPKGAADALARLGIDNKNLLNYGREYSISQTLATASEAGIPTGELIRDIMGNRNIKTVAGVGEHINQIDPEDSEKQEQLQYLRKRLQNMKIADEFDKSDSKDEDAAEHDKNVEDEIRSIIHPSKVEPTDPDPEVESIVRQIEDLNKELEQVLKNRRNSTEFSVEYLKRTEALERKKALLIGNAVAEIDAKNAGAADDLKKEILSEIERLTQKPIDDNDKKALENLKQELEHVNRQNN